MMIESTTEVAGTKLYLSYFSAAAMRHQNQSNLLKKEFTGDLEGYRATVMLWVTVQGR